MVGESLILYHLLNLLIRPLKEFMRDNRACSLLFETQSELSKIEQNLSSNFENHVKVKESSKASTLTEYFSYLFGYKSVAMLETGKEISLAEDIVEVVRAQRVIKRSPYFGVKR